MRTAADFYNELVASMRHPRHGYAGKIMPAAEIYSNIRILEEVRAYQDALELMLESDDVEIKRFVVDLCLGFFVFYDVIKRPIIDCVAIEGASGDRSEISK